MVVIFYTFLCSLIFLNYMSKRRYENKMWTIAILVLWFLCVFVNDDYVDWEAYQAIFNNSNTLSFTKDIGFGALCFILNKMGFEPISLRIVIFTVGFYLLNSALKKIDVNKLLFLAFYSYYPIASEAMHLRTYIVSSILIYAIISFTCDKNRVKFISLIILSAIFHKMAVFYLPMLLTNKVKENNKNIKRFLGFIGILVILVGWNQNVLNQLSSVLVNISETVDLGNSTNSVGANIQFGWIIDWTIQLLFLAFLYYIRKHFMIKDPNKEHCTNIIFWINVIALLFLPFYLISFDYFRMFRNMLAVNYMAICLYIQDFQNKNLGKIPLKKLMGLILAIILVGVTGYIKVGYRGRAPQEFYNFFYNQHISFIEYNGEK